ncbi:MAG TPA: hypothetical protein VII58_08800, partial [Acidobacteriaceae bacterium]
MLRYAITDGRRLGTTEAERADALVEQASRLAARGDIDYLQLREKDLAPAALAGIARRILDAFRGAPFVRDKPARSEAERPSRTGEHSHGCAKTKLLINSR